MQQRGTGKNFPLRGASTYTLPNLTLNNALWPDMRAGGGNLVFLWQSALESFIRPQAEETHGSVHTVMTAASHLVNKDLYLVLP